MKENVRQGDGETGRQGEGTPRHHFSQSPFLPVSFVVRLPRLLAPDVPVV